jgi:hypothetical protein
MTLKLGCRRGPAGVARAAMKPLSSRIADESPVATTNTPSAVSEDSAESQRAEPQQVDEETAEYEEPHQHRNDRRRKYERAFFHE